MNSKFFLRLFILPVATLFLTSSYAQTERKLYDSIAGSVQANYNARQPEKIYAITGAAFRLKMSEEQFALGMSKFYAKAGNWNTFGFSAQNEKGLDYQAGFENSRQLFSLKLDDQGKISRLNFAIIPVIITKKDFQVATNNPLKDSLDLRVEQLVRPYIQKANTSGLILAIIDKGKIRKYSYGTVNKYRKQLPDPEITIFEIGSVTKTFTSLLLAREVIAGRMKLDDPINLYLRDSIPALNFQGHPITLKQLANHTSGFPRLPANIFNGKVNAQDPYKHYLPDSLYSFLMTYRPVVMPGTVFSYSNYGAGVLGTLLEWKEQHSFEQLVISQICKPLGMNHTTISLDDAAQKNFAQGYNEKSETTDPWDLAALKGSGAIRSTLNDMIIYVLAQMGTSNPLKKAIDLTHKLTFESKEQTMGLGWRISAAGKSTYLHHSGGTGGFRSFVGFDPARQFGVVILSNAAEDVTALGLRISANAFTPSANKVTPAFVPN
jgi:CubicO group peptidase (beta-lactamase class C family)